MRKNGLARLEANTVVRGARAWAGRWYRSRRVVADDAFQDQTEPYPGHWRQFPHPWAAVSGDELLAAVLTLPPAWREVLLRHDGPARGTGGRSADEASAAELGLTEAQERDILTRARAALRDALDEAQGRTGR